MNCAHCVRLLDARIDGELDTATAADLDAHIDRCIDCGSRRGERAALAGLLARARDPGGAPPDLARRIRQSIASPNPPSIAAHHSPTWRQAMALALSAAAFASAVTVAILRPAPISHDDPLTAVAERHVAALAAGAPRAAAVQVASSERHQVKPWFQGRVPLSPPVPDLASEGFELVGGRVERIGAHEAAVVAYRIRQHPVELYAWLDNGPASAPRTESVRGFSVAHWRADGLALTAISDVNPGDLARFVAAVEKRPR